MAEQRYQTFDATCEIDRPSLITANSALNGGSPQAKLMKQMDREDIIEGCTDVLEEEQKLGYLP